MKARQPHVVPLSPYRLRAVEHGEGAYTPDKLPNYVLDGGRARRLRLGVTDLVGLEDFQPRDLRRTCATGMARCGDAAVYRGARARARRSQRDGRVRPFEYFWEKRVALDAWARRVSQILKGEAADSVVPFQRGA